MSGKFWDKAWSLVDGCTPVSAGCDNCWLAAMAHRFIKTKWELPGKPQFSVTDSEGCFNGRVTFREDRLDIPLRTKKPTVFAIWSDLYHESVTDEQIGKAVTVMVDCPQHTFLIVTKRPERPAVVRGYFPDNVYHLVTVENQEMADHRIPHALKIPGKVGLLIEPVLGPVDLSPWVPSADGFVSTEDGPVHVDDGAPMFSCVLLGGETGPNARPIELDWIRSVRDQCHMAGVPFYLKHIDKKHGRLLDEQEHNDLPWRMER